MTGGLLTGRLERSVRLAYFVRIAEGDGRFDDTPVSFGLQSETVLSLRFDVGGGHVLGLDHDGRAAGRL